MQTDQRSKVTIPDETICASCQGNDGRLTCLPNGMIYCKQCAHSLRRAIGPTSSSCAFGSTHVALHQANGKGRTD